MYTMWANASNNSPSYTYVGSYMLWRVHPRGVCLGYYCDNQQIAYKCKDMICGITMLIE